MENPPCTDGKIARQRSLMQMTARSVGSGATKRSKILCMAGIRSSAESNRAGSTPRVEKASAFSCTASRSFSKSTITIEIPNSICGMGPRTSPVIPYVEAAEIRNCPKAMRTAQKAKESAKSVKAREFLRLPNL